MQKRSAATGKSEPSMLKYKLRKSLKFAHLCKFRIFSISIAISRRFTRRLRAFGVRFFSISDSRAGGETEFDRQTGSPFASETY